MSGDGEFPPKSRKVPAPDAVRNFFEEEVIGNKTDAAVTTVAVTKSIMAYLKGALNNTNTIVTLLGQVIDVHQNVVGWCDVDNAARFEISLIDKDTGPIPSGNITSGNYVINRYRNGAIDSFADAGAGQITVTVPVAHGFSNGDTVEISGTTNYDGQHVIANVAALTFEITDTWVATETGTWGGWHEIVGTTTLSKDTGLVYLDYYFEDTDWQTDDTFKVTPSGTSVSIGGHTYYPAEVSWLGAIQDISTIEGKIDIIDAEVGLIQADIGDPSSRTNLQNLEDILGNPDTAGKTTYEAVKNIRETAIDGSSVPVENTLSDILHKDGSYTYDNTTDSLEAISNKTALDATVAKEATLGTHDTDIKALVNTNQDLLDGTTATPTAYRMEVGVTQVKEVSIVAAANAGVTTVGTITSHPCLIKSVVIHADAAQTADMTTCAVEGGTGQVVEFIGTGDAIQANLDAADKQVSWYGSVRLDATKTIAIDLQGTGATAVDLTVTIEYIACVDGGYVAPEVV